MFEQFSLIYEIHTWLRYLTWGALLLVAVLLVLLGGGFPPHAWLLLAQAIPATGRLLALRGPIIFFPLVGLCIQSMTWLALWCLFLYVSGTLLWRTRVATRTQSTSSTTWMPSSPHHPPVKKSDVDDARNTRNTEEVHPAYAEGAAPMQHVPYTSEETVQSPAGPARSQSLRAHAQASTAPRTSTPVTPTTLRQFANPTSPIPPVAPDSPLLSAPRPGTTGARERAHVRLLVDRPTESLDAAPGARRRTDVSTEDEHNERASYSPRKSARPTVPFPKTDQDISEIPTPFKDRRDPAHHNGAGASPSPVTTVGLGWDPGIARKNRPNEDSVATIRGTCTCAGKLLPFGLYLVTDGMGGHANGQLASQLAIRSMLETVLPGVLTCEQLNGELTSEVIIDTLIDGVHWANQVVYQYAYDHGVEMGTTITAALVLNSVAYVINVGDSRTYIFRPGAGLTQITRDHSLVARLVETGAIAPDDIYTHPDRNKVYRGLGDKNEVTVDWFILPVQPGDLLLLCSDGLWEMVRDPHIAHILTTYSAAPTLASSALTRAALKAGGVDNVSVLVVKVGAEA